MTDTETHSDDETLDTEGLDLELPDPSNLKAEALKEAKSVIEKKKKTLTPAQLINLEKARAAKIAKQKRVALDSVKVTPETQSINDADLNVVDQTVKEHLKRLKAKYNVAVYDAINRQRKANEKKSSFEVALGKTVAAAFDKQASQINEIIEKRLRTILEEPLKEFNSIAPTKAELKALVKSTANDLEVPQKQVQAVLDGIQVASSEQSQQRGGESSSGEKANNSSKRDREDDVREYDSSQSSIKVERPPSKNGRYEHEASRANVDSLSQKSSFSNYF